MSMKVKTLSALAGIGAAMIMSASANAAFTGLTITSASHTIGAADAAFVPAAFVGANITTFQIFANFDNANDALTAVFGQAGAPMTIQIVGPGTFMNHALGGNTAPTNAALFVTFPALAWDTYLSIGIDPGAGGTDGTGFSTDFFGGPSVNTPFSMDTGINGGTNHAWFNATGPLAGADNKELLAQFSVLAGSNIQGTINVQYRPFGATQDSQVLGVTFNTVPAPGALALIGLAGLVGARRRRA